MRKVKFYINDTEFFRKDFKRQNPELTNEQIENLLKDMNKFEAVYTLISKENNDKDVDRYTLECADGRTNINDLNGYERGVILNDCIAYFNGSKKYYNNAENPCGVVKIEEITD